MRDGAILANAGHFDVEVDVRALAALAVSVERGVRPHTDEYVLADGRRLLLLAEGRIVNLVAAEGNPPMVMDVSFAGQALVLAWLAREHGSLLPGVHQVPAAIDDEIARLALGATGRRHRRADPGPAGVPRLLAAAVADGGAYRGRRPRRRLAPLARRHWPAATGPPPLARRRRIIRTVRHIDHGVPRHITYPVHGNRTNRALECTR